MTNSAVLAVFSKPTVIINPDLRLRYSLVKVEKDLYNIYAGSNVGDECDAGLAMFEIIIKWKRMGASFINRQCDTSGAHDASDFEI